MLRAVVIAACTLVACGDNESVQDDGTVPSATVVAPATLRVIEGESASFVVMLAEDPHRAVPIEITSRDTTTAVVTTSWIQVSSANFATGETVIVRGEEDDGDVINDTTELEISIAGDVVARVATTVFDNDIQQIIVDTSSVTVAESGTSTFHVRLAREPSGPVTATLVSSLPSVIVSPATLTFGPSDYDLAQTVTVTAAADADTVDNTATIQVGDVATAMTQSVQVMVTDDDVQALVLDAPTQPLFEGDSVSFTVALAFDPLGQATVQLQSSDPGAASLPTTSLVFTSGNYNVPQTVTVVGTEDADALNDSATLTLSGAATGSVSLPVFDNDDIIVVANDSFVYEGRTSSFTVKLANDPGPGGKTVDVSVLDGEVTVAPSTLSFTSANYASGLPAQVYALVDDDRIGGESARVRVSAPKQTSRVVPLQILDVAPGTMNLIRIGHESVRLNAVGWMEVQFWHDNPWPADGRLLIELPAGYDASAASVVSTSVDGALAISATTSSILLTRSGGTTVMQSGDTIAVRIANVRNPGATGYYPVKLTTQTGLGEVLDRGVQNDSIGHGWMPNTTVTLANLQPGATGTATITFTTDNPWPADGLFELSFPLGFDASGVTMVGQSGVDGAFTATMTPAGRVRLTRSGGTTLAGGSTVSLTIGNITNPPTSQVTTFFEIWTELASGESIDVGFPQGLTIGCPATMTRGPQNAHNAPLGGNPWDYPMGATEPAGPGGAQIVKLVSSDYLVVDEFHFSVPAGATITGIRFDVEHANPSYAAVDSAVRIVTSSIRPTDRSSTAPWASFETVSYGGAGDLWGETWSAADIESNTFGLALAADALTPGMSATTVGYVSATIYLSCP
jgi:hypothetical protein